MTSHLNKMGAFYAKKQSHCKCGSTVTTVATVNGDTYTQQCCYFNMLPL